MKYNILFEKSAKKFILKQPPEQQKRLFLAINKLPFEGDFKKMKGYTNYYRLRVGDYRVIYTKEDQILVIRVINVGNRGDVYKK